MVKPSESSLGGDMSGLPALQPLPTAAQRAADVIRENIFEGRFTPGTALPEATLANALQVSRNTIREAFRTLIGEHLLAHEPHKGVMVRRLEVDDVRDIYKLRRLFELSALELAAEGRYELNVVAVDSILAVAKQAAEDSRWNDIGTINLRFHTEIVAAHQSARIDEVFRRLMTEIRLGFLAFSDPASLHTSFLPRNRKLYNYMIDGKLKEARQELAVYLDDAEDLIISAVREHSGEHGHEWALAVLDRSWRHVHRRCRAAP